MLRPLCLGWLIVCSLSVGSPAPAAAQQLQYPLSIAVSSSGTVLYLADRNLPGVWKLEGGKLTKYFAGSRTFRTPLNAIRCVILDQNGQLLAGDSSTREVYRFDPEGQPHGLTQKPTDARSADLKSADLKTADLKTADKQPAGATTTTARPPMVFGEIGIPMDLAVGKSGDLFVSDLEVHRIVKVAAGGGPVHEFVQIPAPRGLCLDDEEHLWVVSGRTLVRVSPAGEKTTVVADGTFNFPHTVAVASDKTAYVCDGYEKCIWKVPLGGQPEKLVSGEPLVNPVGMRLANDKLYVVDPRAKAVFEISRDGKLTTMTIAD